MADILDQRRRAQGLLEARREPGWRERLVDMPAGGAYFGTGHDDNLHTFMPVWERARRPDAGAGIYAYMSLELGGISPCGPGFDVQGPGFNCFQPPPLYATQAARVQGVPLQSGGFYGMPLTTPMKSTPVG